MEVLQQGTIIRLANVNHDALVLSREFFNKTGMVILCPVLKTAGAAALNIFISTEDYSGYAIINQLKSIDIQARYYKTVGKISYDQMQNISDAVQDIFSYYPW